MSKPGGWSRVARLCLPVVVTVGLCSGALVSVATTTPPAGAEVAPDLPDAAPAPTDLGISASTALSAMAMTAKFGYCIHTGPSDGSSDVLMGCAMQAVLGGGGGTDPKVLASLQKIHEKLDAISSQLNDVQSDLKELFKQNAQADWNKIQASLSEQFADISGAFTNLQAATNPAFTASERESAAETAKSEMKTFLAGAGRSSGRLMATTLLGEISGTPGIAALVAMVKAASGRFFQNPVAGVSDAPMSANTIQEIWTYLADWQAKLMILLVADANANKKSQAWIDQTIVYHFMGSPSVLPNSDPPIPYAVGVRKNDCNTDGAVTRKDCAGWIEQEERLVPQSVPAGTVIDTSTNLMWQQRVIAPDRYEVSAAPYSCPDLCPTSKQIQELNGSYPQKTAFNNWTTPTAPQLQGLVANPAGSSVGGWLSTAGGFNVLSGSRPTPLTSSSNAGEAWTMTNAAYVHCARDHPSCKTGGMQYVTGVNLKTGASSKMINDIAYNEQHLGVAVRTPSSCAFYYGAAPKDKASPCYLTVVRATWSNGTSSRDVTGLVQSMVSEGQLHIVASTNVLGAVVPSPATPTTTTTTPKTRFTIPTVPIGIAPGTVPSRTTTTTTPGKPAELTLVLWRGGTLEPITKVVAQGASFSYSS